MADKKLNYQQARRIRKSKFSDMVLDQLADKDTGVFGAIGKTISLRSQARMKGIKEKFDPLNIVKFMTMGSRFGPALFGKLTGRNQKDIDYFTGRTKSVVGSRNTAEKINKLSGEGDSEGLNEQLAKIYSFLKNSREEDIKLKELSKNKEEEISLEKEKRHKELIDTLNKLVNSIGTGGTAEPVKQSSFLDDIMNKLKSLADFVGKIKDLAIELAGKLGMKVAQGLLTAGRWGMQAAGAAFASGAAVVGGVVVGGAALATGATNVLSNMTPEMRNQLVEGDKGSDTSTAAAILNSTKSKEELATYEDALTKYRKYMEDAPWTTRAAALYNSAAAGDYLRNVAKIPKKDLDLFEKYEIIPKSATAEPVKKTPPPAPVSPAAPAVTNESGSTTTPPPLEPNRGRPTMQNDPRLAQISQPTSAPVSTLSGANADLNLPSSKPSETLSTNTVNRTINNIKSGEGKSGLRPIEINVRNNEPTFMGLIVGSTRMV